MRQSTLARIKVLGLWLFAARELQSGIKGWLAVFIRFVVTDDVRDNGLGINGQ
jgi:hypothetical protein